MARDSIRGALQAPVSHGPVRTKAGAARPKPAHPASLEFEWGFIQKGLFLCADSY